MKKSNNHLLGTHVWQLNSKKTDFLLDTDVWQLGNKNGREEKETIHPVKIIFFYLLGRVAFLKDNEKKVIELREKINKLLFERLRKIQREYE